MKKSCHSTTRTFLLETNPVKLWSSPTSTGMLNKVNFKEIFGPFYRVQKVIFTPKNSSVKMKTKGTSLLF